MALQVLDKLQAVGLAVVLRKLLDHLEELVLLFLQVSFAFVYRFLDVEFRTAVGGRNQGGAQVKSEYKHESHGHQQKRDRIDKRDAPA